MADPDEEEEEAGVSEYQTLEDLVREAKEAKEQEARDKVVLKRKKYLLLYRKYLSRPKWRARSRSRRRTWRV